ncbi:MAG: ThiF family adenylyltransferase [Woeseiaceae bacterium]|nr:ThiF family adenylyltransferase [Woeseiaceae bacterium]
MREDLARYHRQMLLPGFGEDGQRRLADSRVLLLGCGALGSIAAEMLARAGVGHLVIVDRDFVELTNLQRQLLYDERDVADAIPKAIAAKERIARINSAVAVTAIVDDINHTNIAQFADGADVLVDGLDNFETRYLANDLAVKTGRPYVYGAAVGTTGMAFTVLPATGGMAPWERDGGNLATPCFRCLFDAAPPPGASATCDTVGVIGAAVGIVANFQVAETLKILTGNYDRVSRALLNLDLWANEILQLEVPGGAAADCPCCRHGRFDYLDGKAGSDAASLCGRDAVQLRHRQRADGVDLDALARRLRGQGSVRSNQFMLQAHIADGDKAWEITLFPDGRAIVKGTDDPQVARSIYARYVGA